MPPWAYDFALSMQLSIGTARLMRNCTGTEPH